MRTLLDTNTLVWATDAKKQKFLGKQAKRILETSEIAYISSISLAELKIKLMIGKFKKLPNIMDAAIANGYSQLAFNANHADAIENFPSLVRHDPFDRMLLAQAYFENLTFLTSDEMLLGLGLSFVVDARE